MVGWLISVLGKTVGRGCWGLRNSVGWDVGVLEERERDDMVERERSERDGHGGGMRSRREEEVWVRGQGKEKTSRVKEER